MCRSCAVSLVHIGRPQPVHIGRLWVVHIGRLSLVQYRTATDSEAADQIKSSGGLVEGVGANPGDEEVGIDGAARHGHVQAAGNGNAGQPKRSALVEEWWEHGANGRGVGNVGVKPDAGACSQGQIKGGRGGEGWDRKQAGTGAG